MTSSPFFSALQIAGEIQSFSGPKLVDWKKHLASESTFQEKIAHLREEVETFADYFIMPGHPTY